MNNTIFIGHQASGKTTKLKEIQESLSSQGKNVFWICEEQYKLSSFSDYLLKSFDHIIIDSVHSERCFKFFVKRLVKLGLSFSAGIYFEKSIPKSLSKNFEIVRLLNSVRK